MRKHNIGEVEIPEGLVSSAGIYVSPVPTKVGDGRYAFLDPWIRGAGRLLMDHSHLYESFGHERFEIQSEVGVEAVKTWENENEG